MFVFGMISAVLRDRKGISAMEYAILAAAVLTAVGAAATTLSGDLSSLYSSLSTLITSTMTKASGGS
jgi:pilus assembly protein Flp/PilA